MNYYNIAFRAFYREENYSGKAIISLLCYNDEILMFDFSSFDVSFWMMRIGLKNKCNLFFLSIWNVQIFLKENVAFET